MSASLKVMNIAQIVATTIIFIMTLRFVNAEQSRRQDNISQTKGWNKIKKS